MAFKTRLKDAVKGVVEVSGPYNQSRVPLNLMPRNNVTRWPVENRPNHLHAYPESRTYKGIFRRYPNGTLDFQWATGQVELAVRKLRKAIPLTENEALAVCAVFPGINFSGLPKSIVKSKAHLTQQEAYRIKKTLAPETFDALYSMNSEVI